MRLKNIGKYEREIIGVFGRMCYSRTCLAPADEESAELLCKLEGRKSIFPLDMALGIEKLPYKVTPSMMCVIAKYGVQCKSYQEASKMLNEAYHIGISDMMVERITDYVGELVFEEQQREALEALEQFENNITVNGKFSGGTLFLFMDGAMVHIRDKPIDDKQSGKNKNEKENSERQEPKVEDGWMESKHALAYHSSKVEFYTSKTGEPGHRILEKDYVGYIGTVKDFTPFFLSLARRNGCDNCEVVVITDGARLIINLIHKYLPNAMFILDLFHVKENAGKFAQAVIRGKTKNRNLQIF